MTGRSGPSTRPVPDQWTVLSLIQWSTGHLEDMGFDETRLHAELLLAHVLGLKRLQLYLQFDRPLTPDELASFKRVFKRRLDHEPLQYILGETEFMGITLAVAPGALIPRPETELLVEKVVAHVRSLDRESVRVLDVGTGSGNIAIAVARLAPSARVTAVDHSPEALTIARLNVERHHEKHVSVRQGDVRQGVWDADSYDVVVSNPPYIAIDEYLKLQPEVRDHEPRIALTDEGDGLSFYRTLFALAAKVLGSGGRLFCEIGYGQADAIGLLASSAGIQVLDIFPDLAGIPRVLHGRVAVMPVNGRG